MGQALDWLSTPAAAAAARRSLGGQRLPASLADDVLQDARLRVWRQEQAHAQPPDAPEAVARRAIHYATRDLTRHRLRRPDETPWDPERPIAARPTATVTGEDDARRILLATRAHPTHRAAALAQLTFTLHPDVPVPAGAPEPTDGGDDQRTAWAALWLAGERCFPPDDAASRKRRSRTLDAVRKVLEEVVALMVTGDA